MTTTTRNVLGASVLVAAAAITATVMLSPTPPPKKLYPRMIKPITVTDAEWAKRMEAHAKTNVPGTTRYIKVKK